jgi:sialidase-1
MFIGMGMPIPDLSNLPGPSRPGGGGGAFEYTAIDNSFSMEFDGVSHYDADNLTTLNGTQDATVCCWIKRATSSSTIAGNIISTKGTSIRDHGISLRLRASDGRLDCFVGFPPPSGGFASGVVTNIADTNWHHIAVVIDRAAGTRTVYIDGAEADTLSKNNYSMSGLYYGFTIGARAQDGVNGFIGHIDEVAVFASKLSEETIQAIYDTTANNPGKVADLSETPEGVPVAWYRMGD